MLGDMTITVIKDGSSPLNVEILGNEDQRQEVQDLLAAAGAPTDQLINTFNVVMLQMGDDTYLIDTGLGAMTSGLLPTMELLGVSPADVTGVIGTHWHPDHVNGLSNEGEIVFPNAMYYLSQTEFDFVQANAEAFTGDAAAKIAPYADNDQLSLYNAEDEVVPGVQAVAAPGHTPGHHAMLMSSNGNSLLHAVDSLFVPPLQMANPDIGIQFDADPMMAAASRRALLERAADEGIPIMSYHMPFPGMGFVARDGDAFSFYAYN
jgi:glyoxylase-like metal-dependent hydrolase (beta-lactamase superfamily II)